MEKPILVKIMLFIFHGLEFLIPGHEGLDLPDILNQITAWLKTLSLLNGLD